MDHNEEEYQGLPDSPEIYVTIENSDKERAANSYDQYIGDEFVISDQKGERLMGKVRKSIQYDDKRTGEVHYNAIHNTSVYEV